MDRFLIFFNCNIILKGENHPCLIYGLRGVIDLEIEITGPCKDLHSGFDGGPVNEPFHELIYILSHIVDGNGRVLINGKKKFFLIEFHRIL